MSDEFEVTAAPAALYVEQQAQNNMSNMSARYRQYAQQEAERHAFSDDDTGYDPTFAHLRLACLQLAIRPDDGRQHSDDDIMRRAERFWHFVEFGSTGIEEAEKPREFDLRLNRE